MSAHNPDGPTSFTDRLFHILDIISSADGALAVQDIADQSSLPQPTVHRIVAQFETLGLVVRDPSSRRVTVGPRLFNLSQHVMQASSRQGPVHAILSNVTQTIDESCALGILDRDAVVYVDCVEASWPLSLKLRPGSRVPLHCTSIGKLILAYMPSRQRERLMSQMAYTRYTDKTVIDAKTLTKALDEIRKTGFAITDQEFIPGVVGVAVGVFAGSGKMLAGLSIRAPEVRLSIARARELVPALQASAQKISELWDG